MTWRPLCEPDQCAGIAAIIREIVTAVDGVEATSLGEHLDRALLHAYVAREQVAPDVEDRSSEALSRAVAELVHARVPPSLLGGAAGVGWCVSHLAAGEVSDLVCARVDGVLMRLLARWEGDYDLVSGLVGVGVYALARGEHGRALSERVLDELAARARRHGRGLGWCTPPRSPSSEVRWNLGLAHGVPGVIALLARQIAAGVDTQRSRDLLEGAVELVLAAEPARDDGRYPPWQVDGPDGPVRDGHQPGRARLAWCYNDLGVSVALLSAASATGVAAWRDEALRLARACATRSVEDARVLDTGLCHGAIGVAHLFNRLGQATGDGELRDAARRWLARGLVMRNDHAVAGFPSLDDDQQWRADASLLGGATGVALALHAMITTVEPAWDRLLLVDLDPAS